MLISVQELAEKHHLSERQVRLRLSALDGLLQGHTFMGDFGKTLVDDYVLTLFDQLRQLESGGLSTSSAVNHLRQGLAPNSNGSGVSSDVKVSRPEVSDVGRELVEELRARIQSLEQDKVYLQTKLDEALGKIPALPAPKGDRARTSRLAALRYAILGR